MFHHDLRSSSYSSVAGSSFAEEEQGPETPHPGGVGEAIGYDRIVPIPEFGTPSSTPPTVPTPFRSSTAEFLLPDPKPVRPQQQKKKRFSLNSLSSLGSTFDSTVNTPGVFSHAARVFLWSIALFAGSTSILLVVLEILQTGHDQFEPNVLLQPQTIASEAFLLFAAYMALKAQNLVQIIAVVLFNIYLVISGLIEAGQRSDVLSKDAVDGRLSRAILGILWTVPVVDAAFHFGVDWAAWQLYKELGWLAYKRVSADVALRKLYQYYLILSTLLMFATFFSTAQAYTLGVIRAKITLAVLHADARYWIVGHALAWIVYISAMALAWLSMHRESEEAMIGSVMAQLAYLGWSIRVIVDFDFLWSWFNAPQEAEQRLYRESFMPHKTLFQIIIAHLVFLATLIYCVLVGMRFNRGLMDIRKKRPPRGNEAPMVDLSLE